jgi:hypothetical protein
MEKLTNSSEVRKAYSKPQLKKVDLKPEEAVLGNCKSGAGAGPSPTCNNLGGCMSLGS